MTTHTQGRMPYEADGLVGVTPNLNKSLEAQDILQSYWFKFLTPSDYDDFFQEVKDNKYREWHSSLMNLVDE